MTDMLKRNRTFICAVAGAVSLVTAAGLSSGVIAALALTGVILTAAATVLWITEQINADTQAARDALRDL